MGDGRQKSHAPFGSIVAALADTPVLSSSAIRFWFDVLVSWFLSDLRVGRLRPTPISIII